MSVEEQGINSDVALVYVSLCLWRNKGLTVMSLLCMCLCVSLCLWRNKGINSDVALVYVSLCVCVCVEEQGINSDVALVYVSLCVCGGTRD